MLVPKQVLLRYCIHLITSIYRYIIYIYRLHIYHDLELELPRDCNMDDLSTRHGACTLDT